MNVLRICVADIVAVQASSEVSLPRYSHRLSVMMATSERGLLLLYKGDHAAEHVIEDYDTISRAIAAGDEWVQVGSI